MVGLRQSNAFLKAFSRARPPSTDNASAAAFLGALLVGCSLHYRKIVKNAWFGYPDEWFPSVSATIGDHYPERSLFQVLIAITAGTNPYLSRASGPMPS